MLREVAVWTGPVVGGWSPADLEDRGLGGAETTAVRLSEELTKLGYSVTLFGEFAAPGAHGDVALEHHEAYDPERPRAAVLGLRDATLFDDRPNAATTILWLADTAPSERLTPERAENVDHVFVLSRWHARQVRLFHPWLSDGRLVVSRNGIERRWFAGAPRRRERRIVCSSSPDRGAAIVLECLPEIRRRVPDAEVVLTYPRWIDLRAEVSPPTRAHLDRVEELLAQPGATRIPGGLGQGRLADLMRSSLVWAHPSCYRGAQPFYEVSCIGAMEAQAAGLAIVAGDWGALPETVAHGTLVDGDPRVPDGTWRHAFVEAVVRGLTDQETQRLAQTLGPAAVANHGWDGVAAEVAATIPA